MSGGILKKKQKIAVMMEKMMTMKPEHVELIEKIFGKDLGLGFSMGASLRINVSKKRFMAFIAAIEAEKDKRIAELRDELEIERCRLAACSVAALGYFEGCKEEYKSASLDDVLRMREKLTELERDKSEHLEREIEHERLKQELNEILHPNCDGPKSPSFCDLVAFVKNDLRQAKAKIAELERENERLRAGLSPVINWLENGCDPLNAAKELKLILEQTK